MARRRTHTPTPAVARAHKHLVIAGAFSQTAQHCQLLIAAAVCICGFSEGKCRRRFGESFTREGESSTAVTPSRQHAAVVVSLVAYAMADTGWSVQCSRQAVVSGLDPYHQTFAASRTPVNMDHGSRTEAHRGNRGEGGTPLAAAAVGAWIRCDARA